MSIADQVAGFRAAANAFIDRITAMRQAGITFGGKRNLNSVLGYLDVIVYDDYRARYERGGLAGTAVDIFPNATWRGEGGITEDDDPQTETELEKAFRLANETLNLWPACLRADRQASIGGFSIILLGAEGKLSDELPRGKALKYIKTFAGSTYSDRRGASDAIGADVTAHEWDTDPASERFGQPTSYFLRRTSFSSPALQIPVHWTRCIHIPAEGFLDDAVFGPPRLQRVWNHFDELDKVSGGGSEAYWLRANQPTLINIDKDMKLPAGDDTVAALQAQVDNWSNQMSRVIRGKGVNIETGGSDVADFSNPVDCLTTLIAGCLRVPKRILLGSEMGNLASTQDRENWRDQINDRRSSYALPTVLRQLVVRMQKYGYLPLEKKPWQPNWSDVVNLSESEKSAGAESWAAVNQKQGETVFTSDEIRDTWYGLDPLDPSEITTPDVQTEQAQKLEAALRRGGVVSLVIKQPETREKVSA